VHVWETWPKTRRFCILGPFSWAIAHSFGVPEWFTRSISLSTCLRGMTKNSSFLCFRAVFVRYCPLFWVSMEIYKEYESLYILERNDKKDLSFLRVWPFLWAIAHSFGVPGWSIRPMTLSTCLRGMKKTHSFCILGPFLWAITHSFGILGWFTRPITLNTFFRGMTKNLSFYAF
jgi:hypothetical protein